MVLRVTYSNADVDRQVSVRSQRAIGLRVRANATQRQYKQEHRRSGETVVFLITLETLQLAR